MKYLKSILLIILLFNISFLNYSNKSTLSNQKIQTSLFDRDYIWVEKNNGIYGGLIWDLAMDPKNPNIIFAACRRGLYKTIDGGKNWSKVDMGTEVVYLRSIAIDPNEGNIIYVGGINLLYKSTDGGKTWEYIKGNLDTGWVNSISINKTNSSYIYIASQGGAYKSTDGGKTWVTLMKNSDINCSFWNIESDPYNPDIIYLSTYGCGLFKTIDGGKNWKQILKNNSGMIKVDPKNPKNVYSYSNEGFMISNDGGESWKSVINGLGSWWVDALDINPINTSQIYIGVCNLGVFKSEDSGKSWINITNNLQNTCIYKILINYNNFNNITLATEGGIYQTIDGGNNWFYSNNGINSIDILKIFIDPNNKNTIYVGGSGIFKSTDGGNSWQRIDNYLLKGQVFDFTVDKYNTNIIYFSSESYLYKSTDGGKTWQYTNPNHQGGHIGAIEIHPFDSNIVYYASHERLYRSTNGGKTWEFYSQISEETDWSCDITIDNKNPNIIYICRHESGCFKSIDGGKTWKNIKEGNWSNRTDKIFIDPNNSNILYLISWGGGVYKSIDAGDTWTQINKNIFSCCAYNLSINPNNSNELLLATHLSGIYYSNNGGNSWSLLRNTNLYTNDCAWVEAIWEPELTVFIGTYGGGVYKLVFKPTPPLITKIEETYNGVKITWDKSKEGTNPISGYEIYRSEGPGKYEIIGKVDSDKNTFIDKNISTGKTYYYYIKSYDTESPPVYSDISNIVSIKISERNIILKKFESDKNIKYINKILSIDKNTFLLSSDIGLYKIIFLDNTPQLKEKYFENKKVDDFFISQDRILSLVEGKLFSIINNEIKELKHPNNLKIEKITSSKDLSTIYFIDIENNLYKSSNYGDNFNFISKLSNIKDIQFISVNPDNPNILFIGTKNGLFRSTDGGKTFNEIDSKLKNKSITSITYNPYNSNEIFLSTWGDNIYFSNNIGENFEPFGNRERNLFTNKITPHPEIPYLLYASTSQGLYVIDKFEDKKLYEDENSIKDNILSEDKLLFSSFGDGLLYYIKIKKVDIKNEIKLKFETLDSDNIKLTWDKQESENIKGYLLLFNETKTKEKFIPFDYLNKDNNFKNIKLSDFKSDSLYFSLKIIDNEIIPNISDISNILEINKLILSDKNPPELNVSIPQKVKTSKLEITGRVIDKETGILELKINNVTVNFDINGSFIYHMELKEGDNIIKFEVLDKAGNKLIKTFTVNFSINLLKILLQIGNKIIYINDTPQEIDVPPQIIEGRTYLPIRYIAEPIGASVEWDSKEKKVTIKHKNTTIELWINKNTSKVNGVITPIDPNNPKVTPLIISGRTMLPVRFVAENLGCKVDYDSKYKLITITYELD